MYSFPSLNTYLLPSGVETTFTSEVTSNIKLIEFRQPKRERGKTKNNYYTLYDLGILGIIKHSKKIKISISNTVHKSELKKPLKRQLL